MRDTCLFRLSRIIAEKQSGDATPKSARCDFLIVVYLARESCSNRLRRATENLVGSSAVNGQCMRTLICESHIDTQVKVSRHKKNL